MPFILPGGLHIVKKFAEKWEEKDGEKGRPCNSSPGALQ